MFTMRCGIESAQGGIARKRLLGRVVGWLRLICRLFWEVASLVVGLVFASSFRYYTAGLLGLR